jgi:hypothetical protein
MGDFRITPEMWLSFLGWFFAGGGVLLAVWMLFMGAFGKMNVLTWMITGSSVMSAAVISSLLFAASKALRNQARMLRMTAEYLEINRRYFHDWAKSNGHSADVEPRWRDYGDVD